MVVLDLFSLCSRGYLSTFLAKGASMAVHIGTSGWSYAHWEGLLYPQGAHPADRLAYYVRHYRTVEINSCFYRWPADATFTGWYRRTPEEFLVTVKAPRGLTHRARLYRPERWLERVLGGLHCLAEKRGVLLVQLSPNMPWDQARLEYFLRQIPAWLRIALEFRHLSWHREEVFSLLEKYHAAYCVMSGANLPCILRATAPFVYVRLHGPDSQHLYAGSYSDENLYWWAQRIREWTALQRYVFVYFNNDGFGNALRNATALKAMLAVG
jgi:uncharacterized protein YecE (DUF72 family)